MYCTVLKYVNTFSTKLDIWLNCYRDKHFLQAVGQMPATYCIYNVVSYSRQELEFSFAASIAGDNNKTVFLRYSGFQYFFSKRPLVKRCQSNAQLLKFRIEQNTEKNIFGLEEAL